jgi:hypothetical protein
MDILKRSARLCALAALAVPAMAQPVITGGLPSRKHFPVGEWLTVTVEAKGTGALAYQWYKTPALLLDADKDTGSVTYKASMSLAEFGKCQDKSPYRLNSQIYDSLAMECLTNGGGHYWVEVTDTADHQKTLAGPMLLIPGLPVAAWRKDGVWVEDLQRTLVPVDAHYAQPRIKAPVPQSASALAGALGGRVVHPGCGLPLGKAATVKGSAPSAARTETKAGDAGEAIPAIFLGWYDEVPALVDPPAGPKAR